ncbi:MAG: four helix bundle protein [Planctomycetota bacterium]
MDRSAYRKLDAWQRAMDAFDAVYALSRSFPTDERFGLTSQLRRAALSVPSNIAEGYGRKGRKEYLHHLFIARGSLMETETQLIAAVRQGFCSREDAKPAWALLDETGRLLTGLIRSLKPTTE